MERGSIARAAVMGGLLCAVLNATPLLSGLNYCCCLLVVLCGAFAGWVLKNDSGFSASTGRCAVAGAFSGVIGGLLGIPLQGLANRLAMGVPAIEKQIEEAMAIVRAGTKGSGEMPPGFFDSMENAYRALFGLDVNAWTVVVTLFGATFFSFFGLLGGLIGAGIARPLRRPAPPPGFASPRVEPPLVEPPPVPAAEWTAPEAEAVASVSDGIAPEPAVSPSWPDAPPPPEGDDASGPIPQDELPRFPPRETDERE
jgi:hypothetical protein